MKWNKLFSYFLPHPETHQKSPLISWHFLFIYLLLFILLRAGFELVSLSKPGVLGTSSTITAKEIVEETNKARQQKGLSPLQPNQALAIAAETKARNMFEENYWAHFSPTGRDPWQFILRAGYRFSYAGENLARNFSTSEDVVTAWMASSAHRDNILNSQYQDIGIAVVDGVLNGQKTTLVVQMLGKTFQPVAQAPQVNLGGKKINLSSSEIERPQPVLITKNPETPSVGVVSGQALVNPTLVMRIISIGIFTLLFISFTLDLIILKKRGVFRLSSHHLTNLSFLTLSGASILMNRVGDIL